MRKGYVHFVREIYSYCDSNVGERALFPVFANLWNENEDATYITQKDLAVLTSQIISKLLEKKALMKIPRDENFHTPYGLYKILPHENLRRYDDFAEKKMKLIKLANVYSLGI